MQLCAFVSIQAPCFKQVKNPGPPSTHSLPGQSMALLRFCSALLFLFFFSLPSGLKPVWTGAGGWGGG